MLPNDAVFCKECGVRMGQALTNSKRNRAVLIAIVLAAAIIAVGGYAVWHSSTHKEVGVDVTIAADGWGDGSSPVPFTITDTDLDGKQVSKTVCLNPSDGSIQLQRGTYTIAAAGSPVTSAGGIFTYPSDILNVTVDKDGAHVGEQSLDKATFAYTAIAPENVSDAQLQAITDWMAAAGIDSAKASAWVESARAARSSRQSEVAASQAASQASTGNSSSSSSGSTSGTSDTSSSSTSSGTKTYTLDSDPSTVLTLNMSSMTFDVTRSGSTVESGRIMTEDEVKTCRSAAVSGYNEGAYGTDCLLMPSSTGTDMSLVMSGNKATFEGYVHFSAETKTYDGPWTLS